MEGGDRQLTSWLKEEGFHTSLRSVSQARLPPADLLPAQFGGLPALSHAACRATPPVPSSVWRTSCTQSNKHMHQPPCPATVVHLDFLACVMVQMTCPSGLSGDMSMRVWRP